MLNKNMKSILLAGTIIVMSLTACAKQSDSQPSDKKIIEVVQNYITASVDDTAKITSFAQNEVLADDEVYEVLVDVVYDGNQGMGQTTLDITFSPGKRDWWVSKLVVRSMEDTVAGDVADNVTGIVININEYIDYVIDERKGYGIALPYINVKNILNDYEDKIDIDSGYLEEYYHDVPYASIKNALVDIATIECDKSINLSNGDIVKYTVDINDAVAQYFNCEFVCDSGEFLIEGISYEDDVARFSPFDYLEFELTGKSGEAVVSDCYYYGPVFKLNDFKSYRIKDIKNGDYVSFSIYDEPAMRCNEKHGLSFGGIINAYTAEGLEDDIKIKPFFDVMNNVWGRSVYEWNFRDYVRVYDLADYSTGETSQKWRDSKDGYTREAMVDYPDSIRLERITSDGNYEYINIKYKDENYTYVDEVSYELRLSGWYLDERPSTVKHDCAMETFLAENQLFDMDAVIGYLGLPALYRAYPQELTIVTDMGPARVSFESEYILDETQSGILGTLTVELLENDTANTLQFSNSWASFQVTVK